MSYPNSKSSSQSNHCIKDCLKSKPTTDHVSMQSCVNKCLKSPSGVSSGDHCAHEFSNNGNHGGGKNNNTNSRKIIYLSRSPYGSYKFYDEKRNRWVHVSGEDAYNGGE